MSQTSHRYLHTIMGLLSILSLLLSSFPVSGNASGQETDYIFSPDLEVSSISHEPYVNYREISLPENRNLFSSAEESAISLTGGDFNGDLAFDLIVGGKTSSNGWLRFYPGIPNTKTDFLGAYTETINIPVVPAWIESGDINGDGFFDIVAAGKDNPDLIYLFGDGYGKFSEPMTLSLNSGITTMTGGDLNRIDGLSDIVLGLANQSVAIIQGSAEKWGAEIVFINFQQAITDLAIGQLDTNYPIDLAISSGNSVYIQPGYDQQTISPSQRPSLVENSLGFPVSGIALGDFLPSEGAALEIAAISATDGSILLTPAYSGTVSPELSVSLERTITNESSRPATGFYAGKSSTLRSDDLFSIDSLNGSLRIFNPDYMGSSGLQEVAEVNGSPITALLPVKLNVDAISDLIIITEGSVYPQILLSDPVHTFVVNYSDGLDDDTPGDGICDASGPSLNWNMCTLRAAIQEANASPGLDKIIVSGWYSLSSQEPDITEAIILEGFETYAELNGSSLEDTEYGLTFTSGNSTITKIKFRQFPLPAVNLMTGGSHLITGNQFGDSNYNHNIQVRTSGNQFINNYISGSQMHGVYLYNADNNVFKNNKIGFLGGSNSYIRNLWSGIYIWSSDNTIIGGTSSEQNFISGNGDSGIKVVAGSTGTLIYNNTIGLLEDEVTPKSNADEGISLNGAHATTIGGATIAYRNIISGNRDGVTVADSNTTGTLIASNIFGMDASGTVKVPNSNSSIQVFTSSPANSVTIRGNTIGGDISSGDGIYLFGDENPAACISHVVEDNSIGVDPTRTYAMGLGKNGIIVDGVSCVEINNNLIMNSGQNGIEITGVPSQVSAVIGNNTASNNSGNGIEINTDFNTVNGNVVDTNMGSGIAILQNHNTVTDTSASWNNNAGIAILGEDNLIRGPGNTSAEILHNYYGITVGGDENTVALTYVISNTNSGILVTGSLNQIGDSSNRNVVFGNYYGIELAGDASGNLIQGNYIGVSADGLVNEGNVEAGVLLNASNNTIGGTSSESGNVITGSPAGVLLVNGHTGNSITNNRIGTNPAGTGGMPNSIGIKIEYGGYTTIQKNTIAYNGDGVIVVQGEANKITENRIYNSTRLGIDLMPAGVTTNDAGDVDAGPNGMLNFPVLTRAVIMAGNTYINGSYTGAPNQDFTFHLYSSDSCDPSGYGEGQTYVANVTASTNAEGQFGFSSPIGIELTVNKFLTVTATDSYGSTSEFSSCTRLEVINETTEFKVNQFTDAVDANLNDGICDSNLGTVGLQCTLRAAVQQANTNSGANSIELPAGDYILSVGGSSENAAAGGDLDLTSEITIIGSGANITRVNGGGIDRVFEIRTGANAAITGINITNGGGASGGAGLFVNSGAVLILNAVNIFNNIQGAGGGGIYNAGTLTVMNSAIAGNSAVQNGGGLYQWGGTSTFINSTFSSNQTKSNGGGIFVENSGIATFKNVTITLNNADSDNNGGDGGGIARGGSATITLQNSIVAGNFDQSHGTYENGLADCAGELVSNGYNLIGDQADPYGAATAGCWLTGGTADSIGGNWLMTNYLTWLSGLGPLQYNGGSTLNHSPIAAASGLVVDWGNPAFPDGTGNTCEPLDQLGQPRPLDGGTDGIAECDRGAVELIPVKVSISDAVITEGENALFTVTLTEKPQLNFSAQYRTVDGTAKAGLDYTTTTGTLSFTSNGPLVYQISVPTATDTLNEPSESFSVELYNATFILVTDGLGQGTINDGSPMPSLSIADAAASEADSGAVTTLEFSVNLNSASGKPVSVNYQVTSGTATSGEDFAITSGTLEIAPGALSGKLGVTVYGDDLFEGNEDFTVTLSVPVNANISDGSGTGTIQDEDAPTISIGDAQTVEGDSGTKNLSFDVVLSNPSTSQITVKFITSPGSANANTDYSHTSGTLIFAPGENSKRITISIVGDTIEEATETFTLSLNTPTGGSSLSDSSAVGTILDNDALPIGFHKVFLPLIKR